MSALEHEWPDDDRRDAALINALGDVYSDDREVTKPQLRILEALSHGSGTNGAADILGLSLHTINDQTKKARRLLGAKNTIHACCEALRLGLIQ